MSQETPDILRGGIVKPTVELRHSLEQAERCRQLFEQGKFTDYLDSVNESYLGGQGRLIGPTLKITSGFDLDEEYHETDSEPLGLNENARGGLRVALEYDPDQKRKGEVAVQLQYDDRNNCFTLYLSATLIESMASEEANPISSGKSLSRRFLVNPTSRIVGDVDDLLLTFTGELLEERFI